MRHESPGSDEGVRIGYRKSPRPYASGLRFDSYSGHPEVGETMISISAILFNQKAHIPATWRRKNGLRALFPPGYGGSISPLKHYVYSCYCELGIQGYALGQSSPSTVCLGYFWVMADAQGNWFFGWRYGPSEQSSAYPRQAGLAFKFAVDGLGLGYVDKSAPPVLTNSCNAGTDARIAKHWPQMFSAGVKVLFQLG